MWQTLSAIGSQPAPTSGLRTWFARECIRYGPSADTSHASESPTLAPRIVPHRTISTIAVV